MKAEGSNTTGPYMAFLFLPTLLQAEMTATDGWWNPERSSASGKLKTHTSPLRVGGENVCGSEVCIELLGVPPKPP